MRKRIGTVGSCKKPMISFPYALPGEHKTERLLGLLLLVRASAPRASMMAFYSIMVHHVSKAMIIELHMDRCLWINAVMFYCGAYLHRSVRPRAGSAICGVYLCMGRLVEVALTFHKVSRKCLLLHREPCIHQG